MKKRKKRIVSQWTDLISFDIHGKVPFFTSFSSEKPFEYSILKLNWGMWRRREDEWNIWLTWVGMGCLTIEKPKDRLYLLRIFENPEKKTVTEPIRACSSFKLRLSYEWTFWRYHERIHNAMFDLVFCVGSTIWIGSMRTASSRPNSQESPAHTNIFSRDDNLCAFLYYIRNSYCFIIFSSIPGRSSVWFRIFFWLAQVDWDDWFQNSKMCVVAIDRFSCAYRTWDIPITESARNRKRKRNDSPS